MSGTAAPHPLLDKQPEWSRVSLRVFSGVQSCPFYRQELQLRLNDWERTQKLQQEPHIRALTNPQGVPVPLLRSGCGPVVSQGHSSRGEVKPMALQPSLASRAVADPHCLSGAPFPPGPLCLQSAARSQAGRPASQAFSLCRHSWGQEVGSGAEEPGAQFGLRTFFLRSQTQFCVPFERK